MVRIINQRFEEGESSFSQSSAELNDGGNVSSMLKAKLRPMILQLDPEFEPTSYDFLTFNDFITGCLDNV